MNKTWTNPGGNYPISVRKCMDCGWIIRHPIRWCVNCGSELKVLKIPEREYYEWLHEFYEKTGWTWWDVRFDTLTGRPIDKEKE